MSQNENRSKAMIAKERGFSRASDPEALREKAPKVTQDPDRIFGRMSEIMAHFCIETGRVYPSSCRSSNVCLCFVLLLGELLACRMSKSNIEIDYNSRGLPMVLLDRFAALCSAGEIAWYD